MTTAPHPAQQVSLIRKELVALTQDSQLAVVLNQLLYWTQRVKDFKLFLKEEASNLENPSSFCYGWIYKTADELIEETLLTVTRPTMRKYLRILVEEGWMEERRSPDRRWDRTAHFRLNLKRIREELLTLGYRLSCFEKDVFDHEFTNEGEEAGCNNLPSNLKNLTSKDKDLPDQERNLTCKLENLSGEEKTFPSKLNNLTSKDENLTPKLKNLTAYTYTETTHNNTNKDYQQRPHAQENFSDFGNGKSSTSDKSALDDSVPDKSVSDKSVAEEMVSFWEYHVVQNLATTNRPEVFHLTEERKDQLESLFAFHFQNDIRSWERFCMGVKTTPFLMGEGLNGWVATLNWILRDGSVLKVLEGKYENSNRTEQQNSDEWKLGKIQPCPANAEKAAIIASIKDPVWKNWCTQLAEGIRLNEFSMQHQPLSVNELQQIANARFLECEEERLVWVGSADPKVLRKIDDLRFKINWVFATEYPKAGTVRTRLETDLHHKPPITGENHA